MAKLTALGLLVLVVLLGTAAAVAAEADTAEWSKVNIPAEGKAGGWKLAPDSDLARLSLSAGVIYLNKLDGESRLMRSEDGGLSWAETGYRGGAVVDIVCSSDTDTIYLTDGLHVYKSDGGEYFDLVGEGSLPVLDTNESITCLDVGDNANHPIVFIGTADGDTGQYGGVYYLTEGDFGAGWTDMMAEGYDIYAIAAAPQFDHSFWLVALASDENHSYIIDNKGTAGGWAERAELLKNNTDSFVPDSASRIVFPNDFDASDELFVGVSSGGNGGVYRVNQGAAQDLGLDADITSLDIAEDADLELVAGGNQGQLWYSPDGGESWPPSRKAPTGDGAVYVAADFSQSGVAYAATSGRESAFSVSRDGGLTWNQLSLIDSAISDIIDLAPSPRDDTLFMLTHRDGGEHSLWRRRDGVWERVFCSVLPDVASLERLALCPQYDDGNRVVLVAGASHDGPAIWKSSDDGQSFDHRRTPLPVDAWAVVDDSTWFIGGFDGANGRVFRVTNSGLSYSLGSEVGDQPLNSIALSPNYIQDETILVGNKDGWVYWSNDNGQSFDPLGEPLPQLITEATALNEVSVAFDAEYSSNDTVYAASHCTEGSEHSSVIYRFIIDKSDDWKSIDSLAEGAINKLIVSAEGTMYAANFAADGGMERCLNPTYPLGPSFESATRGLEEGAKLVGLWLQGQQLWSVDSENTEVVSYLDSLTAPVTLLSPLDGEPGAGVVIEGTARNVSLDWETLEGATEYQWQLNYGTDFSELPADFEGTTSESLAYLHNLSPAAIYYWRVRAIAPNLSPWSETWSFTTSLGQTVDAPELYNPQGGATGVAIEPIFQWSAIAGADSYELMVSTFAAFDNPTILKTDDYALPSTAWQCNVSLNYDTTYYWKVRAVSANSCSAWSAVGAFSTEPEPSDPSGTIAEATTPTPNPTTENTAWPDWLLPVGGIVLLVVVLTMIAMIVVMVLLVIKVSKL